MTRRIININQPQADELLQMSKIDLAMLLDVINNSSGSNSSVDEIDQSGLIPIVKEHRLPTIDAVGPKASNAA